MLPSVVVQAVNELTILIKMNLICISGLASYIIIAIEAIAVLYKLYILGHTWYSYNSDNLAMQAKVVCSLSSRLFQKCMRARGHFSLFITTFLSYFLKLLS